MMSKNVYSLAVLLMVLFSYAASRSILSKDALAEVACNPFSGWQSCVGKRIAENSEAKELERAADNLAFDTTEYVSARESSNIDDVSKFERLNTRQDGEDNEDAKQRFFNTFLQLVKEKSKNNRD